MNIQFAEIISSGNSFCIGAVLDGTGKPTEEKVFLHSDRFRVVDDQNGFPYIILHASACGDGAPEIGNQVAFVYDVKARYNPTRQLPPAFIWGLWEEFPENYAPPIAEEVPADCGIVTDEEAEALALAAGGRNGVTHVKPDESMPTVAPIHSSHRGSRAKPGPAKRKAARKQPKHEYVVT